MLAFVISFLVLLILKIPIAMCLSLSALTYLVAIGDVALISVMAPRFFSGMNSFEMLAIPLFILSGDLLSSGKASKALIDLANSLVGSFRGGLATVTTLSCMFFGAVSGSGPATTSAIGSVIAPEAENSGYDRSFLAAVIAASGPLGILIPPSIAMVVYGAVTGSSVGKLLISGIGPGVLFGGLIIIYSYFISRKKGYGAVTKFNLKDVLVSFRKAIWALMTPIIILGGIYSGKFTPTEASVIATVYSLFVGMFVYKALKIKDLPKIFLNSAISSAAIMFVAGGVVMFSWVLIREQIPQLITAAVMANITSPLVFLLLASLIIFFIGMIMNPSPAIILMGPLLLPIVNAMNIDPVYFGSLMVANLAIGFITPPVALTLYVSSKICEVPLSKLIPEIVPFVIILVIGLLILIFVPNISMFLPNLIMH